MTEVATITVEYELPVTRGWVERHYNADGQLLHEGPLNTHSGGPADAFEEVEQRFGPLHWYDAGDCWRAETAVACPRCGSTELSFDWDAVVTVRIKDGHVTYAMVGGTLDVLPDQMVCGNCGEHPLGDSVLAKKAVGLIGTQLPENALNQLRDETVIWKSPDHP